MKMNILNLGFFILAKIDEQSPGLQSLMLIMDYLMDLAKFDRDNTVRCHERLLAY